jgi:hypothetical protein
MVCILWLHYLLIQWNTTSCKYQAEFEILSLLHTPFYVPHWSVWPLCVARDMGLRPSTHQGNWQPQHNPDFWEKLISSRQLVTRLACAHWGNLISCSHHLKWVCLPANFVHFFSAMSDNSGDSTIIWWWLIWRKKRRQGRRNIGCICSSVKI